ncbi:MAG: hypothetical protein ACQEP5_07735 [Actinomycetota bacterium]
MKNNKVRAVTAIAVFVFMAFFSISCILTDIITGRQNMEEEEVEDINQNETPVHDNYTENIKGFIKQLRETMEEGREAVAKFEQKELGIRDMDDYIYDYIETVEGINQEYIEITPPQDAQAIHRSFGEAMDEFLASVQYLQNYLDTSMFNINEKIEHLKDAYEKIRQGEALLDGVEQQIEDYSGG